MSEPHSRACGTGGWPSPQAWRGDLNEAVLEVQALSHYSILLFFKFDNLDKCVKLVASRCVSFDLMRTFKNYLTLKS